MPLDMGMKATEQTGAFDRLQTATDVLAMAVTKLSDSLGAVVEPAETVPCNADTFNHGRNSQLEVSISFLEEQVRRIDMLRYSIVL